MTVSNFNDDEWTQHTYRDGEGTWNVAGWVLGNGQQGRVTVINDKLE